MPKQFVFTVFYSDNTSEICNTLQDNGWLADEPKDEENACDYVMRISGNVWEKTAGNRRAVLQSIQGFIVCVMPALSQAKLLMGLQDKQQQGKQQK